MRFIFILSLLSMSISQNTNAQCLEDYQWKNRILLLVDSGPDTDVLKSQHEELTSNKKALDDRDLIIFCVTPETVYFSDGSLSRLKAKKIFDDLDLDSNFKGTLLLGKDGGIKLKKPFVVSAQEIFDLIDSMPMRRREIRESARN